MSGAVHEDAGDQNDEDEDYPPPPEDRLAEGLHQGINTHVSPVCGGI
jgi:hypothetical protein